MEIYCLSGVETVVFAFYCLSVVSVQILFQLGVYVSEGLYLDFYLSLCQEVFSMLETGDT